MDSTASAHRSHTSDTILCVIIVMPIQGPAPFGYYVIKLLGHVIIYYFYVDILLIIILPQLNYF